MAVYNVSFMNNVTSPLDLLIGLGTAAGDPFLFGYLTVTIFFLVFLMLALKFDFVEVLAVDGFLTTILTAMFFIAGLVPASFIAAPFVILAISIILLFAM